MRPSSGPGPLLVLQHSAREPPGAYEDELQARGIAFHRVLVDEGQPLPDWREHAALLVMGGGMAANDEDTHPWLGPEKALIAEAVRSGMAYWGVCLGAQLLAAGLGARVQRGPRTELGVLPVQLTSRAARDPVFAAAPARFLSLQWHEDTYELPSGAQRLARSDLYEQQAFVLGRAYAVQFHLEVTPALAAEWMEIPDYAAEVEQIAGPGGPAALLEQVRAAAAESVPLARALFSRWLVEVVGYPATTG